MGRRAAVVLGLLAGAAHGQFISNSASVSYRDASNTTVTTGSNAVSLAVVQFLGAGKGFTPGSIPAGGTATLTVTVSNPNTFTVTDLGFTDVFPAAPGAMSVAAPLAAGTTCAGASVLDASGGTLGPGDTGIRLTGGSIPAGGSCSVSVDVTAPVNGTYTNTLAAGAVTTSEGATNGSGATADLIAGFASPGAGKAFLPSTINLNGQTTLRVTLGNAGTTDLTGVAFTDNYPAGFSNSATPSPSSTCGGTVTAVAGGTSLALSGGTIPASGSCTVSAQVRGTASGAHTNTLAAGAVTTAEGVSNTAPASATLTVSGTPSPAVVTFYQYAPGAPGTVLIRFDGGGYGGDLQDQPGGSNDQGGATFRPLPAPKDLYGITIDTSQPLEVRSTGVYHAGEPVLVTLADANRNADPAVREFVNLRLLDPGTGDVEVLRLRETGPDTGVFSVILQSFGERTPVVPGDGRISVAVDTALRGEYTDVTDPADAVQGDALIDPFGIVFDSITGAPVDGAVVQFINADTGQPGAVFGDDGISTYPSTVVSGASATDSSGTVYVFPPGGYRFPLAAPGNYRIVVTPPAPFTAPSAVCSVGSCPVPAPPGPYAVVQGSFGDVFPLSAGPPLNVDVPVDAAPGLSLLLQKAASRSVVSGGDFLQYRLTLRNRDETVDATNTVVTDVLPPGFRYRPGSLRIGGAPAPDPAIGTDGRTLTLPLGTVPAGQSVALSYVAQVVTGTAAREAVNVAGATANGGAVSNQARATVRVREPLLGDAFTIIGRVLDECGPPAAPAPACPAPAAAPPVEPEVFNLEANFDSGRATLKARGREDLDSLVARLRGTVIERIEVIGHTDSQRLSPQTAATFRDNRGLSEARARSVGEYLAQGLGLEAWQVQARGMGADQPVADNGTAEGMAKNRRTEVRIHPREKVAANRPADCPAAAPLQSPAPGPRGLANVRVVLEDGTYVTTDADGLFHFEGVRPGTHVVQLDYDTLPPGYNVVPRIQNTRFAGRGYSQFVEAGPGALWRADFHVCPASGDAGLRLQTVAGGGEPYEIAMRGALQLTFRGSFDSGRDTLRPESRAELEDLLETLRSAQVERLEVVGHTDDQRLGPAARARFGDNQGLSLARARTIAGFLASGLGLDASLVNATGRGSDAPVAPNATEDGRARNRRVEVIAHGRESEARQVRRVRADFLHRVTVDGGVIAAENLRVSVLLPPSEAYIPGTARLDGEPLGDPEITEGRLTWHLGSPGDRWHRVLEFLAYVRGTSRGNGGAQTATQCPSTGYFLVQATGRVDSGERKDVPLPTVSNRLVCGLIQELDPAPEAGGGKRSADTGDSGRQTAAIGLPAERLGTTRVPRRRPQAIDSVEAAGGQVEWLARAAPGISWLFPDAERSPRAPATRIVIQHAPDQKVELRGPDGPVHPLTFDGTETDAARGVAVSLWRGVPLSEGENRFEARVLAPDGSVVQTLTRVVFYANAVARAELVPEKSAPVADGIQPPVIAVRMLDRDGRPVRAGVTGTYAINAPFTPYITVQEQQERQLAGPDRFQPTWQVEGDEGIAYLELAPTTDTGEAVLTFAFQNQATGQVARRLELRTWIEAAPREWLLVGFVEGTVGYRTLHDNAAAAPAGVEDEVQTDGQAKLYGKGRVLGKWLLTLAYDSDKGDLQDRRRGLLSTIDPEEYYTLYGDGTEQRYDAPSQDKLYLKLERRQFYALFGDFDTGLTVTRLSRYNRTLNGVKTELGGGPLVFNAFASETAQDFARDEIRGNGTSGLYRLSRRNIVINSEKLRLETRDRLRSERILDSRALVRHQDYDIDYTNGTLFFREPVSSSDPSFNPIFIVAEYETFGGGDDESNSGGRVGLSLLDGRVTTGVTHIHEEQFLGKADLSGFDFKARIGDSTEVRLETARSEAQLGTAGREGTGNLAEVEYHNGRIDALLYTRRLEPEFGLNQQNASETGMWKQGGDLQLHLAPQLSLAGQAYRQENLSSDATRDVASGKLQYRTDLSQLSAGYQVAADESAAGQRFESEHATFSASRWFFGRSFELFASGDVGLDGRNANTDFPSRYQAGANYAVTPDARLFVAQEFTDGQAFDTSLTRAGVSAVPWQGARLSTTLNQGGITEYGPRTFAQLGLTQSLLIDRHWGVDLSVDSSRTFSESGQPAFVFNPEQPSAVGGATLTDDFVAVSGGLTYRASLWSWNARAETRDGSTSDRVGFASNFLRQARAGVAFSASVRLFETELAAGSEGRYGNASLSWAWRPLESHWSILDRLEFRYDELDGGTGEPGGEIFGHDTLNVPGSARTRRLINNFNLNRVSREWSEEDRRGNLFLLQQRHQWSLYYGSKYAFDRFDGVDHTGYTDLTGFEWRYDVRRWLDAGLQAGALHAWKPDTWEYSAGPQVGFTPFENAWISFGYNVLGFYDRDFDAARYTAEGPYLRLRFKFDQNTRFPGPDRQPLSVQSWEDTAIEPRSERRPGDRAPGAGSHR